MKHLKKIVAMFLIFVCMGVLGSEHWTNAATGNTKKWRIGYCQSEAFTDYASTFYCILQGLEEKGLLKGSGTVPFKEGQDDTLTMWKWLSSINLSDKIEFVPDAYYDLKTTKIEGTGSVEEALIKRLNEKKDIDLMIVMGTKAGIALSNTKHSVQTLVFSTSDPIGSGIIKSDKDSGLDHVWAHVDQGQLLRQVQVFYDIFGFKKLGLVYENSSLVENYIALKDIERVAKEKNFELTKIHVNEPKDASDTERYYRETKEAYKEVSTKVDAMLITVASMPSNQLPPLLEPLYEKKIPIFSQIGEDEVRHGALMSITSNDFSNLKTFAAETIEKVLKGENPRKLPQVFESTPHIILNLEAAKKSGYKPPIDILLVADKIYKTIEK